MFQSQLTTHSSRLIVIPFSFLRRLDSLKYTSVIALVSIGYLVVLVVAHFATGDTWSQRGTIYVFEWGGPVPFFASLPVMVFAYTCHQNVRIVSERTELLCVQILTPIQDVLYSERNERQSPSKNDWRCFCIYWNLCIHLRSGCRYWLLIIWR